MHAHTHTHTHTHTHHTHHTPHALSYLAVSTATSSRYSTFLVAWSLSPGPMGCTRWSTKPILRALSGRMFLPVSIMSKASGRPTYGWRGWGGGWGWLAEVGGSEVLIQVQWNLSIKDTLNKGHLSNEDTVCSPNHIELCKNLPLN